MNRYLAFAALACLYCSPGLAQIPTTEASAAKFAKPKNDDPERKVCEKIVVPGTRVDIRRVCATPREWADIRRNDREWIESVQRGVRNGN